MKKLTTFLLSGVLLFGAAACANTEKTSADAPATTEESPKAPEAQDVQEDKADAQSKTRREQLNADIRANEERNNALNNGAAENRDQDELENEVRSKLEANIPDSQLAVEAEEGGAVVVSGTVQKAEELDKIESLAKEIKGVQTVTVKATAAPAKSGS